MIGLRGVDVGSRILRHMAGDAGISRSHRLPPREFLGTFRFASGMTMQASVPIGSIPFVTRRGLVAGVAGDARERAATLFGTSAGVHLFNLADRRRKTALDSLRLEEDHPDIAEVHPGSKVEFGPPPAHDAPPSLQMTLIADGVLPGIAEAGRVHDRIAAVRRRRPGLQGDVIAARSVAALAPDRRLQ